MFFRLISVLGRLRARKPEVLIVPEGIFYNPLFERYLEVNEKLGYRITFPVMNHPPRSLAWKMIQKGTIPFYPRKRGLLRKAKDESANVRRRINELMVKPEWKGRWELEGIDFSPVFERIIREVVLPDIGVTADFVLSCREEMRKRPITRLIVPNDKARTTRVILETAKQERVETFYFEHGLTTDHPPSSFVGGKDLVDTMICWGERDRDALLARGVDPGRLIVQTPPFLADYLPMRPRHETWSGKVLILQHCYSKDHVNGVAHCEEEFLIDLCTGLRRYGIRNLRLKLHPGVSMKAYFEKRVVDGRLDVEVFKNENLRSLILWSDLVVGPISTAVLEVLMLGRDYYCVDLEELGYTEISPFDNDRIRVFSSVEEVLDAIRQRGSSPCDREVVRSICGIDQGAVRKTILDSFLALLNRKDRPGGLDRRPKTGESP